MGAKKTQDGFSSIKISKVHTRDYLLLKAIAKKKDVSMTKILNDCIFEIVQADAPLPDEAEDSYTEILVNSIPAERKRRFTQVAKRKGLDASALLKQCIFQVIKDNKSRL